MRKRPQSPDLRDESRVTHMGSKNPDSKYHITCYSRYCKDILNKTGLICCTNCRKCYHSEYPWHCNQCKICVNCNNSDESKESTLLICEACDRGFHLYCTSEKLSEVPQGSWFCDDCQYCKCCDAKLENDESTSNCYSEEGNKLCSKCMNKRNGTENGRKNVEYCIVCSKQIESTNTESNDKVNCKKCSQGSHSGCSKKEGGSDLFNCEISTWVCNNCNKIQLSQISIE